MDNRELGKLKERFAHAIISCSVKTELIDPKTVLDSWETLSLKAKLTHLSNALQQWEYVVHDTIKLYKEQKWKFIGGVGSCICTHKITNEFYIAHPTNFIVAITGCECIKKLGNAKHKDGAIADKKLLDKEKRAKIKAEKQRNERLVVAENNRIEAENRRMEAEER